MLKDLHINCFERFNVAELGFPEKDNILLMAYLMLLSNADKSYDDWLFNMLEANKENIVDLVKVLMQSAVEIEREGFQERLHQFVNDDDKQRIIRQAVASYSSEVH